MKIRKGNRGFTLIELVIVMVIIGILAAVSVPLYRGFVRRAMASEGVALAGAVRSGQRVYLAEHNEYKDCDTWPLVKSNLDLDIPDGKYFDDAATIVMNISGVGLNATFDATITAVGTDAAGIWIRVDEGGNITKGGL